MRSVSTSRLLVSLAAFLGVAAVHVRVADAWQERIPWKLFNDLNVKEGAESLQGSVTVDTYGRMLGQTMLLVELKADGVASERVVLDYVDEDENLNDKAEGFQMKGTAGTRSRIRFKSNEITERLARKDGLVQVNLRMVMGHFDDNGKRVVDRPLTNTVGIKVRSGKGGGGGGNEISVPHIGIFYEKVPYQDGTFGARLTRDAVPGSPAAQLRIASSSQPMRLEKGDTIIELDNQRFRSDDDVRNHRVETTMRFVDSRTGQVMDASLTLP